MDWLEILMLALFIVVMLAVFADPICNVLENVFVYRDTGHGRRLTAFHDAGRAAGFSYQQTTDLAFLQEAMAKFRREASDAVRLNPTMWLDAIAKAQQAAFDFVAQHDRALLGEFGSMVRGLCYGDILYPDEARMVDRSVLSPDDCRPTEDQFAAMRIVKPG